MPYLLRGAMILMQANSRRRSRRKATYSLAEVGSLDHVIKIMKYPLELPLLWLPFALKIIYARENRRN